ncbi:ThiF family adenylyltransferase [Mesorhizobium calcicola]|uniref:ThiF family adenylyltransferase n=1 Tax=Mesorhizobium calcicola TaxID=1300310 RepID=A0ABW4W9E3_9HYPH
MLTIAQAIDAVSALFETYRPEYRGYRACEDAKGRPTGRHQWLFGVWGHDLSIGADTAFPYSRPNAYLVNYDAARNLPHVELDGRLCLTKVEFSTDPADAARQVLGEALELLDAHQTGAEDHDLQEDFTNYWNQRADVAAPALSLLYQERALIGSYVLAGDEVFAFASKELMLRWWDNRTGTAPRHTNAAFFVELKTFPLPSEFPADPRSLLELLQTHAVDDGKAMLKALSAVPNGVVLVLVGIAPSGRHQFAGVRLLKTLPSQKTGSRRKQSLKLRPGAKIAVGDLLDHYTIQRLSTSLLDSSASRSIIALTDLSDKRVVVVGCGAVGAGVASLLAKAGVGRLDLVDHENLGWENIRRHELGGRSVRHSKARALASDLRQDLPGMVEARAFSKTIQDLVLSGNHILKGADLIVATTGSLHADTYIAELARQEAPPIAVVFGWMEAWGVAGHALLLSGGGAQFMDGFEDGVPRRPASRNDRQPPKECGNSTTPFGAIEVVAVQAMVAELCLDRLLEPGLADTWRTWWTSGRNLARAEGQWTEDFKAMKPVASVSGVMEQQWP